jgi:hypothetical protein
MQITREFVLDRLASQYPHHVPTAIEQLYRGCLGLRDILEYEIVRLVCSRLQSDLKASLQLIAVYFADWPRLKQNFSGERR